MRGKLILISLIILTSGLTAAYPQKSLSRAEIKQKFVEGNSFFLFEEYSDALPYYLELHKIYPDNNNLNYRIGICYLNIPGQKEKSIEFLEKAIRDITPKYRENSIREQHAPLDAYFYLGNAYRVNNMLDKALDAYNYFLEHLDPKKYEKKVVEDQIQACKNAKQLESQPMYLAEKDLGKPVNSRFSDYRPTVSGDESVLVFTRKLPFYDAVFFTRKDNGMWSPPINLTPELGIDQDFYSASLSYDGKTLYLYKNDQYDGNIYISKFDGEHWSKVIRLNDHINTKYWESHASVTKDGKTLYFTSNRKGGYGGLDIYVTQLDSTGDWGPAVNLGPIINTEYNEETPFISEDSKTLFFSSRGHYNMGGYDIFYSTLLDNGEWSPPLNMGYPINTTDDDEFYQPVGEGYYAYFSKFSPQGLGNMDIFKIEIFSAEHPRKFLIEGTIATRDVPIFINNEEILISLLNKDLTDTLLSTNPDSTGHYSFSTPAGEYNLAIGSEGFKTTVYPLSLPNSLNQEVVNMPLTSMLLLDQTAVLDIANTTFQTHAGDTLHLKLNTEKGSWLTLMIYQDSTLTDSTRIYITSDTADVPVLPPVGKSTIVLSLTDRYGNTSQKEIYLNIPPPPPPPVIAEKTATEVLTPGLRKTTLSPAQLQEMEDFLSILKHYAKGSLLAEIEKINPVTMHFTDQFEIIDYLKKKATVSSYTPEDVDRLLMLAATRNTEELDYVYNNITSNATGTLKDMLDTLDLDKEEIRSTDDLFNYLTKQAEAGSLDSSDINKLMVSMASEKDTSLVKIYRNLYDLSSGKIKKAVNEANPQYNEIFSAWELTNYLLQRSDVLGYTNTELIYLFARIAANGNPDVEVFLQKMIDKSTGSLYDLLKNLNLKDHDIDCIKDLLDYLIAHEKQYSYTDEDILRTLTRIIISSDIDEEKVRELISQRDVLEGGKGNALYWIVPLILVGTITGYIFLKKKKNQ
jgi:tetratricopeptide (TPR) repeat protein